MDNITTSIIENESEISENNAAIAANQQKVYEAGVKAGLLQDPDYAEGYQDGLDSAAGVEWESLLDGRTPVGRAIEADHATKADHAISADQAITATNAEKASRADHATNADYASEASHTPEADHATNADHAGEADHAAEATHATISDNANFASHATTSTVSQTANKAKSIDGVLPIEEGGTGANTPAQAFINMGGTTYQKPWDINENIGSIVVTPSPFYGRLSSNSTWTLKDSFTAANGETYNTYTWQTEGFPAINSGIVFIRFNFDPYGEHSANNDYGYQMVRVLVNGVEAAVTDKFDPYFDTSNPLRGTEFSLPINVSKGDSVSLEVEICVDEKPSYLFSSGDSGFEYVYLAANADTPYKYVTLKPIVEPSMVEILNTLLGV